MPTDQRIFYKQAVTLSEQGHNVKIIAHSEHHETKNSIDIISIGDFGSNIDEWSNFPRIRRWSHIPRLTKIAKKMRAEIYHFHDPELLLIGLYLKMTTNAAVIYDVHEDYRHIIQHREWIPEILRPIFARSFPIIQTKISSQFDAIIPAAEWMATDFINAGHNNVQVIRNFPPLQEGDSLNQGVEPTADTILVYVGFLSPNRGVRRMINLTKNLRARGNKVDLWLLGSFRDAEFKHEIKEYIDKKSIKNFIHMFGYVEYDQIFSYLEKADLGLLLGDTDHYERAFPTKIFEYMAAGLPVVATETRATKEYLDESIGILVNPSDEKATTETVERLINDPSRLNEMGNQAKLVAERDYNWKSESDKLIQLYERVLNEV